MNSGFDVSFEDYQFQKYIDEQPERIAYIDEYGSYGFDFSKDGTSKYYILCAIVIEKENLHKFHDEMLKIKKENGLEKAELKSSHINEDKRRFRIMSQLLPLEFKIIIFIADKQSFMPDTPLTEYKHVFYKNMSKHLYEILYSIYPKLRIIQDEIGTSEFQKSFKNYVENNRPQMNFFNQYDFDFVNSKDELLIQLSDFIAGSIAKSLTNTAETNYLEMLRGKIVSYDRFPSSSTPYWGQLTPEDCKFDDNIYSLAVKLAKDFISNNSKTDSDDKKCQVEVLRYLLYYVTEISPTDYVFSDELCEHLEKVIGRKITRDYLFRRVIAPLRDARIILSSCSKGYKIPISVDDVLNYMNQTSNTVGPMLYRMGLCRKLIKQSTDNNLDVFDNKDLIKYKRYFDTEI